MLVSALNQYIPSCVRKKRETLESHANSLCHAHMRSNAPLDLQEVGRAAAEGGRGR